MINASELDNNVVRVGSLVSGKDDKGKAFEYAIVGSTEADPANRRLSNESPVGKALIGRKKGDTVSVPDAQGRAQAHHRQDQRRVARDERRTRPERSQVLIDRRRKLEELRAAGIEPFPHAFPGVQPIADVKAPHDGLPDGEETDVRARVAGRLAARRGQGKAAFLDVVDRSGRMQLHARVDVLGEEPMAQLLNLDLGDLIGADGTVFRTRRGELSLEARRLHAARQVAAPAARQAPRAGRRRDAPPPPRGRPDVERGDARRRSSRVPR